MNKITLKFKDESFTISESQAFEVGEVVEDVVTLPELAKWGESPKFFKLARAYGAMLRFAGCKVSDQEVHAEMMGQIRNAEDGGEEILAAQAVANLIAILMNGAPEEDDDEAAPEKKKASSKPRSKRR